MIPGAVVAVACLAAASWGLRPSGLAERATVVGCYSAVNLRSDTAAVAADRCHPRPEIITVLRGKLDAYGLHSWSIDDSGFDQPWAQGRPCASLAFDHDRSIVRIVPFPTQ
ncbi:MULTISPECIES: hypothetical protein [unclassified Frankia]